MLLSYIVVTVPTVDLLPAARSLLELGVAYGRYIARPKARPFGCQGSLWRR